MAPLLGAHVELRDVLRLRAELAVGLHVHAVAAVVEVEVVHVGRAHEDLQGVGDLAERHLQPLRLLAVDRHQELGIVGGEAAEEAAQVGPRVPLVRELAGDLVELLQAWRRPPPAPRTGSRRRHPRPRGPGAGRGRRVAVRDGAERPAQAVDHRPQGVRLSLALGDRLHVDEDDGPVGARAAEAEAAHAHGAGHVALPGQRGLHRAQHAGRVAEGGPLRRLHADDEPALSPRRGRRTAAPTRKSHHGRAEARAGRPRSAGAGGRGRDAGRPSTRAVRRFRAASTLPKKPPLDSFSPSSTSADRAGVKVSELKAESAMEKAIVRENCW